VDLCDQAIFTEGEELATLRGRLVPGSQSLSRQCEVELIGQDPAITPTLQQGWEFYSLTHLLTNRAKEQAGGHSSAKGWRDVTT
jgi:hypothetical protein